MGDNDDPDKGLLVTASQPQSRHNIKYRTKQDFRWDGVESSL